VTVRLVIVRLVTVRLVTVRLVIVRLVTVRLVTVRLVTVRRVRRLGFVKAMFYRAESISLSLAMLVLLSLMKAVCS
jgi:hypothetical protein